MLTELYFIGRKSNSTVRNYILIAIDSVTIYWLFEWNGGMFKSFWKSKFTNVCPISSQEIHCVFNWIITGYIKFERLFCNTSTKGGGYLLLPPLPRFFAKKPPMLMLLVLSICMGLLFSSIPLKEVVITDPPFGGRVTAVKLAQSTRRHLKVRDVVNLSRVSTKKLSVLKNSFEQGNDPGCGG